MLEHIFGMPSTFLIGKRVVIKRLNLPEAMKPSKVMVSYDDMIFMIVTPSNNLFMFKQEQTKRKRDALSLLMLKYIARCSPSPPVAACHCQ